MKYGKIAVVIPCYNVKRHILAVIADIPLFVHCIFVIDDACPEGSGKWVEKHCLDTRVKVITHTKNKGVGGATITGYRAALAAEMAMVVKLDGDGQMNPRKIKALIQPIVAGKADYTKGNRFFYLKEIFVMPKWRLLGNSLLSFISKISSGYWSVFDPTNGFTALHCEALKYLPLDKISERYFFESDMLFRLNTLSAVVIDVPMVAKYGQEKSNLKIKTILFEFLYKHLRNVSKRILYNYYLRDMSFASIELPLGIIFLVFGLFFGSYHWQKALLANDVSPAGTVMLAALPIIVGLQFLLSFLAHDMKSVPSTPFHCLMGGSLMTDSEDEQAGAGDKKQTSMVIKGGTCSLKSLNDVL